MALPIIKAGLSAAAKFLAKRKVKKSKNSKKVDSSGMTQAQKREYDRIYSKVSNSKEADAIRAKNQSLIKSDDEIAALVKKKVLRK
jgi:hypothetical protein